MEYLYLPLADNVQELSSLYTSFQILISLSSTHRSHSIFIYQIKHIPHKFYPRDISKFRDLQSVKFPKSFISSNITILTNLKSLKFKNENMIHYLSKLTNLEYLPKLQYFIHLSYLSNLTKLKRWPRMGKHFNIMDISKLIAFSSMEYVSTYSISDISELSQLTKLTNLKKIKTSLNINNDINYIHSLTCIDISNRSVIISNNFSLNKIRLHSPDYLHLDNCNKLKILDLWSVKCDFIFENIPNVKTLLLRFILPSTIEKILNYNCFRSVNYLYSNYESETCPRLYIPETLVNLQFLSVRKIPNIPMILQNKLTLLFIYCSEKETTLIDLKRFINLKSLTLSNVNIHNMNYLTNLEYLKSWALNEIMDLSYHTSLTKLTVGGQDCYGLDRLNNLKKLNLTSFNKNVGFLKLFHLVRLTIHRIKNIKYFHKIFCQMGKLTSLIYLDLQAKNKKVHKYDITEYIFDLKYFSNLHKLEKLNINLQIINLFIFSHLKKLQVTIHETCSNELAIDIENLTNLRTLNINIEEEIDVVLCLTKLTRLNKIDGEYRYEKIILPKHLI